MELMMRSIIHSLTLLLLLCIDKSPLLSSLPLSLYPPSSSYLSDRS